MNNDQTPDIPPGEAGARTSPDARGRPPWGSWIAWAGLLSLLALLGLGLSRATAGQVDSGPAPDFELSTFDGSSIRLSDLLGQVVVINFWASWCVPCRQEAPILEATWRAFRERGVVFIGVDYVDTEAEALAYIAEFDLTYPNGPDLGTRISQAYRIQGVPETFFVDRRGLLRGVHIGPITEQALVARIESLLAERE